LNKLTLAVLADNRPLRLDKTGIIKLGLIAAIKVEKRIHRILDLRRVLPSDRKIKKSPG